MLVVTMFVMSLIVLFCLQLMRGQLHFHRILVLLRLAVTPARSFSMVLSLGRGMCSLTRVEENLL